MKLREAEEIEGLFNNWIKLKVKIHISKRIFYPRERQIWWASLGQNVGVEVNGKNEKFERPVLVLKRFNDDSLLILPISSKIKIGNYYFRFINHSGIENVINFAQTRTISVKRFIRQVGIMSDENFERVTSNFKALI